MLTENGREERSGVEAGDLKVGGEEERKIYEVELMMMKCLHVSKVSTCSVIRE